MTLAILASINWNQVVATAASAVIVIAFLSGVMYKLAKSVIDQTVSDVIGKVVEPAIEKVTSQQTEALKGITDVVAKLQEDVKGNTADIAYLKGVHEGERKEVSRASSATEKATQ